ncbi:hypothetical protein lerEdw1_019425 [Lerista edwardsae]|nr:hypothetical protein lerEdw1_019425 [Lerista edwardsae]
MPVNPKTDPRCFVVIRPLPIPTQQGLKVQARSSTIYNCWDYTREQVFLENYRRRIKQLTHQGYFTPNWKPYQDFADPLYLEPKKVTLYGLGQLPPEVPKEEVPAEEEVAVVEPVSVAKVPSKIKEAEKKPPSFKHVEKDLRNLHRDLAQTRHLINTVKTGCGYFYTLRKEAQERKIALKLEQQKTEAGLKTEFQPPVYPSSSSSSEGETSDEEITELFLTECPLSRESEKKKKKKMIRPFTPVHNGLVAPKHPKAHFESLFRQLCALHWLMEAMTLEPNSSMKPLITCWSAKDYGGGKSSLKMINREKVVRLRWEHFLLHAKGRKYTPKVFRPQGGKKTPKKTSVASISKISGLSSPHSKTTLTSTSSLTPASDEIQAPSDGAREGDDAESTFSRQTREIKEVKEVKEEEEPMSYYLQTLLEMIHEDVARNFSRENVFWQPKPYSSQTLLMKSLAKSSSLIWHRSKSPASSSKDEKTSTGGGREGTPTTKEATPTPREGTPADQKLKSSMGVSLREDKTTTATYQDKESTDKIQRSQSSFFRKKENMCNELREVFQDIAQESAFRLHDQLDIMERRREENSIFRYLCLRRLTKFRRDLDRMRQTRTRMQTQALVRMEPEEDEETESWFSILLSRIPDDILQDHRTQIVLKKLEKFGLNPDLRIRPPTFLKVLGELRIWELCSPDICAAVEFLRENIVQMPAESYREWLQTRIPFPRRAHSAPPIG